MEDSKENKKMRMLAMRKLVRDHVVFGKKNNIQHLGQLDLEKSDNIRLIISLQDLSDTLLNKKRRAEAHIAHMVSVIETYGKCVTEYGSEIVNLRRRLRDMSSILSAKDKQITSLEEQLDKANRQLAVFKEMFIDNSKNQKSAMPIPIQEETPMRAESSTGRNMSWRQAFQEFPGSKGGI